MVREPAKRTLLISKRRRKLITQQAVAAAVGISQAQYSNIENGYSTPSPHVAESLVEMFRLRKDYFDEERKEA